ncbi:hypothetical protein ACFQVA_24785 [Actinomadura keratinilytica]
MTRDLLPVLPRCRRGGAGDRRTNGLGKRLFVGSPGRAQLGREGRWQTAQDFVDDFLDFWKKNDAILRVVDLGAAEGDKRFAKLRLKILNSATTPLTGSIKELQAKGRVDKDINPAAVSGALVVMLSGVTSQLKGFQTWGVKQADLRPNLAQLVHLGVTGKKPTK